MEYVFLMIYDWGEEWKSTIEMYYRQPFFANGYIPYNKKSLYNKLHSR